MKCVIECTCGGRHYAQCTCRRKISRKDLGAGFLCKQIRVLPHCHQYYPKFPVKVYTNHELVKKNGEVVDIVPIEPGEYYGNL